MGKLQPLQTGTVGLTLEGLPLSNMKLQSKLQLPPNNFTELLLIKGTPLQSTNLQTLIATEGKAGLTRNINLLRLSRFKKRNICGLGWVTQMPETNLSCFVVTM